MLKHFAACLLALAALFAALAPAAAEKRVALVIGNAAYQNAPRSAQSEQRRHRHRRQAARARLRGGRGHRPGQARHGKADQGFRRAAERRRCGLVLLCRPRLAGRTRRTTCAPIDAELKSETDLDFEAVELDLVLKQMLRSAAHEPRLPRRLPRQPARQKSRAVGPFAQCRPWASPGRARRQHDDHLLDRTRQSGLGRDRPQQSLHRSPAPSHRRRKARASAT